jgi:ABC-type Fe3+/spermidine/putrescine transport system ATPase subunit
VGRDPGPGGLQPPGLPAGWTTVTRQRSIDVPQSAVALSHVVKRYGSHAAVNDLSFEIQPGEVFTLLGPSGCGKTTTLRIIAGLETPDSGEVRLSDRVVVSTRNRVFVPTHKRGLGMVFQSYAIWPHLNVFENVAYPLRVRHVGGAEVRRRVLAMLEMVGLGRVESNPSHQLSGGEQQRVAFARALIAKPSVLLLDEPFSNLDARLRYQMRGQVKELLDRQKELTVVFVTHDQSEALSMSDRVAVVYAGSIEQIGTPQGIYEAPETPFVRDFLGRTLLFDALVERDLGSGRYRLRLANHESVRVDADAPAGWTNSTSRAAVAIRPEDIVLVDSVNDEIPAHAMVGTVAKVTFVGDHLECDVRLAGDQSPRIRRERSSPLAPGEVVHLTIRDGAARMWVG